MEPGHTLMNDDGKQKFKHLLVWTSAELRFIMDYAEFDKQIIINKLKDIPRPELPAEFWSSIVDNRATITEVTSTLSTQEWVNMFDTDFENAVNIARRGIDLTFL